MILSAYHNINYKNARLKANDILKNDFFSLFSIMLYKYCFVTSKVADNVENKRFLSK